MQEKNICTCICFYQVIYELGRLLFDLVHNLGNQDFDKRIKIVPQSHTVCTGHTSVKYSIHHFIYIVFQLYFIPLTEF